MDHLIVDTCRHVAKVRRRHVPLHDGFKVEHVESTGGAVDELIKITQPTPGSAGVAIGATRSANSGLAAINCSNRRRLAA